MRVEVIGGSGHVGTFLVPRLVVAEREVVSISRGQREPYQFHPAWQSVEQVTLDREAEGPGTTSPTAPTAASPKPGACSTTNPATARRGP